MILAKAVVKGVLEEWRRIPQPMRLVCVGVVIGDLHQVVEDNFRMACEVLARGTVMEGVPVEIRRVPIMVKCKKCQTTGAIMMPFFVCETCRNGDVEVLTGNELYLERLEVERKHDDAQY